MKLEGRLVEYYIGYLEWLLENKKINKGAYELLRIAQFNYDEYENRFLNEEAFREKQIQINKIELRDSKIQELIDENRNNK